MCKNLIIATAILLALADLSTAVFIPITGRVPRCMIVYSVGEAETVKVDLNFPLLPGSTADDYYEISWKNTETNELTSETFRTGRWKRELALSQSNKHSIQM